MNVLSLPNELLSIIFDYSLELGRKMSGMVCQKFKLIAGTSRTTGRGVYTIEIIELLKSLGYLELMTEYVTEFSDLPTILHIEAKGDVCLDLAKFGRLEELKQVIEAGYEVREDIQVFAAMSGKIEVVQYLQQKGHDIDHWALYETAKSGDLEMIKYLCQNGCPWNDQVCSIAAFNGHLDCLKYAHENGCSWTQNTCVTAARSGNIVCLKYAHENGCPWNENVYFEALCEGILLVSNMLTKITAPCHKDPYHVNLVLATITLRSTNSLKFDKTKPYSIGKLQRQ